VKGEADAAWEQTKSTIETTMDRTLRQRVPDAETPRSIGDLFVEIHLKAAGSEEARYLRRIHLVQNRRVPVSRLFCLQF
jgi:hypothetical protein